MKDGDKDTPETPDRKLYYCEECSTVFALDPTYQRLKCRAAIAYDDDTSSICNGQLKPFQP